MQVLKKDGQLEDFKQEKIMKAIGLSAERLEEPITNQTYDIVLGLVRKYFSERNINVVTVSEIHFAVEKALSEVNRELFNEYRSYRKYKNQYSNDLGFGDIYTESKKIIFSGDTENANKNSSLNSTQKELLSGLLSKKLIVEKEYAPKWIKAHNEGFLYIHDLSDRIIFGINCCLFDMKSLLNGGFEMDGVILEEPKKIDTACHLVSNVITNASSQQYGGFTVPEIDTTLAKYVRGTYLKHKKHYLDIGLDYEKAKEVARKKTFEDTYNAIESLEYQINLLNNGQGQTPFVTFTFGLDTSKEGRLITECILKVRLAKMGKNKITAIFPKLVFLHRNSINGEFNSPNYDLKELAIKCSANNLYPDWLSLDNGYLGEVFDRSGKAISPMG